jgi:hypothetical protein
MTTSQPLASPGLPGIVGRFADQEKGLIVFHGANAAAVNTSAHALAAHAAGTTGRPLAVFNSGQWTAVRDLPGESATVILVDGRMDADTLILAVEAASAGALTIVTFDFLDRPYVQLLDLLQSAEDWTIRPKFDAALYAVVQPGDHSREADVFIPALLR